jgi:BirA family biotin operon repressor/biotin-[acetyl-CoA-carboxylase] ligase
VEEVAGVRPGLKWPNDLVVADGPLADRKLAGILAESHVVKGKVDAVVVGMGLNLDWPAELPEELAETAASVNHLTGGSVDREDVLVAWLRHYDRHLTAITTEIERGEFLDEVRAASATLGRDVRVERSDGFFEGHAIAIADDGRLLVDCGGDGGVVAVTVGDIVHARLLG